MKNYQFIDSLRTNWNNVSIWYELFFWKLYPICTMRFAGVFLQQKIKNKSWKLIVIRNETVNIQGDWIQVSLKINPLPRSIHITINLDNILLFLRVNSGIGKVKKPKFNKWSRIELWKLHHVGANIRETTFEFERQIWADWWRLAFASFCTLKNFDHNHHRKIKTKIDANSRWWRIHFLSFLNNNLLGQVFRAILCMQHSLCAIVIKMRSKKKKKTP